MQLELGDKLRELTRQELEPRSQIPGTASYEEARMQAQHLSWHKETTSVGRGSDSSGRKLSTEFSPHYLKEKKKKKKEITLMVE
jgi:hypothetical protein